MNSFIDLVHQRRSVRRFLDKPVERKEIIKCVEAARFAASAENVQPWRFIIIDDHEIKSDFCSEAFSGIYSYSKWASKAPVIVIILAKPDILANRIGKQIQGTQYYLIDIGIAGEHFVLQATELGLGTCWIGWFNTKRVRKFFKIPKTYKIVCLISVGYSNSDLIKERKRQKLDEIMWFNKFLNKKAD